MALQVKDFSVTGKSSSGNITYTYILRVTENSASIVNGKPISNVTVKAILKQSYSGLAFSQWTTTVTCSIDGVQRFSDTAQRRLEGTSEHFYYFWTGDIEHNADGTKSITVGGQLWQKDPESFSPPTLTITESGSDVMVLTPIAVATACAAPTVFTASPEVFEDFVSLTWSGAKGGTNNSITGYRIQCAVSTNGGTSFGEWTDIWQNNQNSVTFSDSFLADCGVTINRGDYVKFRIRTLGAAGSAYYSDWKESNAVRKLQASAHINGEPYLAYIKSGDSMDLYMPCIYKNGAWQNKL